MDPLQQIEMLEMNWQTNRDEHLNTFEHIWIFRMKIENAEQKKYKLIINLPAVITYLFGKVIFFRSPIQQIAIATKIDHPFVELNFRKLTSCTQNNRMDSQTTWQQQYDP